MDKLRLGVLGAGLIASYAHMPNLLATGEVELTAVCRRTPEALQKVADRFGVARRYTDYRAMLDEAPLDAVLISSPHALHFEHVRAALDHGLAVLVDKPLALRVTDAEMLRDLAVSKGLPLLVVVGPPHDPAQRYMGESIARGDLGDVVFAQGYALTNVDALGFFGHGAVPAEWPAADHQ